MKWIFSIVMVLFLINVKAQEIKYLFIGHCYQNGSGGSRVDYRVEELDKSAYEGIWLGGDVCSEAMLNYSTMAYIDSLFGIGNPEVHWTLGNHDARNGNWEWYRELTGRNTYYAYTSHGITRIVMNTNLVPTNCFDMEGQYKIIRDVCDTITESKVLILLMHHGIWDGIPDLPPPPTYAQSNLLYWNANCDSVNTSFAEIIYPMLVDVRNRGLEVICVLGDMGSTRKSFEMQSTDSILFLGCGLYENDPEDLVLEIGVNEGVLSHRFIKLDSLLMLK